jgi:hypothetical protein
VGYAILWLLPFAYKVAVCALVAVVSLTWLYCSVCSIVAVAVCLQGCSVCSVVGGVFVPYTVHGYMAVLSSERRPGVTRVMTRPAMRDFSADSQLSTVTLLLTVNQQLELPEARS